MKEGEVGEEEGIKEESRCVMHIPNSTQGNVNIVCCTNVKTIKKGKTSS